MQKMEKSCKHNISYWTGQPYLGLGTKASSMLTLKLYLKLSEKCEKPACTPFRSLPGAPYGRELPGQ